VGSFGGEGASVASVGGEKEGAFFSSEGGGDSDASEKEGAFFSSKGGGENASFASEKDSSSFVGGEACKERYRMYKKRG